MQVYGLSPHKISRLAPIVYYVTKLKVKKVPEAARFVLHPKKFLIKSVGYFMTIHYHTKFQGNTIWLQFIFYLRSSDDHNISKPIIDGRELEQK
jgi:hypothetical protein